jgi:hypothetical protein
VGRDLEKRALAVVEQIETPKRAGLRALKGSKDAGGDA